MNFDQAFERVIGHEGGYVNDPRDPGGETKFGVSKRAYPSEDIAGLTLERAKSIYFRDYWVPAGCTVVNDALRFELFDTAVNLGVVQAIKILQRAVGAAPDGVIGAQTLGKLSDVEASTLLRRMQGARLRFYTDLKTFPAFGAGWVRRVAANMMEL